MFPIRLIRTDMNRFCYASQVPYAVTLRLNDQAAVPIERLLQIVAEHTDERVDYPPHITFAILPDAAAAQTLEDAVFAMVNSWAALPITFAALGVFPGPPVVVWAAPVVTEPLLALHSKLHTVLRPFGVDPHYQPGAWVPHVTLGQQGRSSPAMRLVEVAASSWLGSISGEANRVDFVRFPPVTVLRSVALRSVR